jgi:hypothetical protein
VLDVPSQRAEHYIGTYFRGADQSPYVGEATPWYFYSEAAPRRIADFIEAQRQPAMLDARFILLLREPADRALSMYRDLVRNGIEHRSFVAAVDAELESLARGERDADVRRRYVWGWLDVLPAGSLVVLQLEDLAADPQRCWDALAGHLAVDLGPERLSSVPEEKRNRHSSPRSSLLQRALVGAVESGGLGKRSIKAITPRRTQRLAAQAIQDWNLRGKRRLRGPSDEGEQAALTRLREHFDPDQEALAPLLRRATPGPAEA